MEEPNRLNTFSILRIVFSFLVVLFFATMPYFMIDEDPARYDWFILFPLFSMMFAAAALGVILVESVEITWDEYKINWRNIITREKKQIYWADLINFNKGFNLSKLYGKNGEKIILSTQLHLRKNKNLDEFIKTKLKPLLENKILNSLDQDGIIFKPHSKLKISTKNSEIHYGKKHFLLNNLKRIELLQRPRVKGRSRTGYLLYFSSGDKINLGYPLKQEEVFLGILKKMAPQATFVDQYDLFQRVYKDVSLLTVFECKYLKPVVEKYIRKSKKIFRTCFTAILGLMVLWLYLMYTKNPDFHIPEESYSLIIVNSIMAVLGIFIIAAIIIGGKLKDKKLLQKLDEKIKE
jgi:hypothetical protein